MAEIKVFHNSVFWGYARPSDIAKWREEFRAEAFKVQKESGSDHVLYYVDERDEQDNITTVWLYTPVEMQYNDAEFEHDVMTLNKGLVGAVHAHR